jgi:drug/metabolite transporter (DMT)-like permease
MSAIASKPAWALVAGASLWGIVWYPYRLLAQAGLDGIWSTALTYGFALVLGCAIFPRSFVALRRAPPLGAFLMAAAIGWSNLAYVVAVLDGSVMRVLLLFYLAPLWTVPIAWIALGEKLDRPAAATMLLALAGAVVMLWRPELGMPWPASRSEWLAVIAGFLFALGNVLVRRNHTMGDAEKSIAIWIGVTVAALAHTPWSDLGAGAVRELALANAMLVGGVGLALVAMSLAMQYGLSRMPANRAIVLLLVELPIAVLAAWLLAGEVPRLQDWVGGLLIVAATLVTGLRGESAAHSLPYGSSSTHGEGQR